MSAALAASSMPRGMGSFYRSQHELVFVFKEPNGPHLNNIQLGKFGRSRTNVWDHPGAASLREELKLHATPKPVTLIAEAIRDCSKCQCRVNCVQKCRSNFPQFGHSERRGGIAIFGWSAAAPKVRLGRRCNGRFRPQMLRHELGMLAQAIA